MALPDDIAECPHCGSDTGYYYLLTLHGEQQQAFGNIDDEQATHFDPIRLKHGACRCIDCRKIIRTNTAH